MADELKLKLDRAAIVGIIPRLSGDGYGNKALRINWQLEKYLEKHRVGFRRYIWPFLRRKEGFISKSRHSLK